MYQLGVLTIAPGYLGRKRLREPRLHSSTRPAEAEWLRPRLRSFGSGVTAVVPDGFPAYVRILHPARGPNDQPVSWADVAIRTGRTMHRLAQFHAIARPHPSVSGAEAVSGIDPPDDGNLSAELLKALCAVLAGQTSTEDSCFFCLWDGYGWLDGDSSATITFTHPGHTINDADVPAVPLSAAAGMLDQPRIHLPYRSYLLFEGPLDEAYESTWTMPSESVLPQSPNLFWPQDHAWCAASEIDLFCTLVAGSEALAETLLADTRFEAWRVFPGDPITYSSDKINT